MFVKSSLSQVFIFHTHVGLVFVTLPYATCGSFVPYHWARILLMKASSNQF